MKLAGDPDDDDDDDRLPAAGSETVAEIWAEYLRRTAESREDFAVVLILDGVKDLERTAFYVGAASGVAIVGEEQRAAWMREIKEYLSR